MLSTKFWDQGDDSEPEEEDSDNDEPEETVPLEKPAVNTKNKYISQ